jgi:hypothetical protein
VADLTEAEHAEVGEQVVRHIRDYTGRRRTWFSKLPAVHMVDSPSQAWPVTLGPAHMPAEPSMASRSRSACPLWRAYSSTRCCHIHRTEVVFSRNVNVSSSFAPSSTASTARHSAR